MDDEKIKAVPSLILDGDKQDATALYICVKEVDAFEKERLLSAIAKTISLHKAVLSESPDGTFLALFNMSSKQYRHEFEAIRTASDIQKEIKNLKSFKLGFGIHAGQIIVSPIKNNIIEYICLGDFINTARKLSLKSENNILFMKDVYNKVEGNLRADELRDLSNDFGTRVYSLNRIMEREKYGDYIQGFLGKLKEDEAAKN